MIGIGLSSIAAGRLSGETIRSGLVPPGLAAVAFVLIAFGFAPATYGWGLAIFFALGLSAGFYIVPLQALLQQRASDERRGRILGTTNFLSFSYLAVGGALYFAARAALGLDPQTILMATGGLAALWLIVVVTWWRRGELEPAKWDR